MTTPDELAGRVQQGEQDKLLELWASVRQFASWRARRWAKVGRGVTVEDLEQEAFLALLDALERWNAEKGAFLTLYGMRLKEAFTVATGQRTARDRMDPLDLAVSLDAPLSDSPEAGTMEETVEDPSGAQGFSDMEKRDLLEHLRADLEKALNVIPPTQSAILRRKYYMGLEVERKAHAAALRAIRAPEASKRLHQYSCMLE